MPSKARSRRRLTRSHHDQTCRVPPRSTAVRLVDCGSRTFRAPSLRDRRRYSLYELVRIDRLAQMKVESCLYRVIAFTYRCIRGHGNRWNRAIGGSRLLAAGSYERKAVLLRHSDVGDEHVKMNVLPARATPLRMFAHQSGLSRGTGALRSTKRLASARRMFRTAMSGYIDRSGY